MKITVIVFPIIIDLKSLKKKSKSSSQRRHEAFCKKKSLATNDEIHNKPTIISFRAMFASVDTVIKVLSDFWINANKQTMSYA